MEDTKHLSLDTHCLALYNPLMTASEWNQCLPSHNFAIFCLICFIKEIVVATWYIPFPDQVDLLLIFLYFSELWHSQK
jgi:hypothetical protein